MAEGGKKGNGAASRVATRDGRGSGAPSDVMDDKAMAESEELNDRDADEGDEGSSGEGAAAAEPRFVAAPRKASGGFFEVYKSSQGGRVRWGSGICAGVLLVWGAAFVYEKLNALDPGPTRQVLQYGLSGAILVGLGLWVYYLLARSPRVIDFLIGTEGEMKKVHWSSRKEVLGSTKVVIFVLFFLAITLFVVDLGLMLFFTQIGVLRVGKNLLAAMFGKT